MNKKFIAQRIWQGWDDDYDNSLGTDSEIIELPQGKVEYCILGEGPPMVITHATPGGYDQAKLFAQPFVDAGYKVICWSRPGYLNTPLSTAKSFEDQADLLSTLMDYLWIDSAIIYGVLTGAAISLMLARKFPEKVDSLFLENPVSAESLSQGKLTQLKLLDSAFFISQDDWFNNLFSEHFSHVPHKISIKGENYFDEALVSRLLKQKLGDGRVEKLIALLKTTGPTEKKETGFYNDIYETTRFKFDTQYLDMPCCIIAGEKDKFQKNFPSNTQQIACFSGYGYQLFLNHQYPLVPVILM